MRVYTCIISIYVHFWQIDPIALDHSELSGKISIFTPFFTEKFEQNDFGQKLLNDFSVLRFYIQFSWDLCHSNFQNIDKQTNNWLSNLFCTHFSKLMISCLKRGFMSLYEKTDNQQVIREKLISKIFSVTSCSKFNFMLASVFYYYQV